MKKADWTAHNGRSNSSGEFLAMVDRVAAVIRDGAHDLLAGRAESVARRIVAELAHKHGLAPRAKKP